MRIFRHLGGRVLKKIMFVLLPQMSGRSQALNMYRDFIRHGKKFTNYNFKEYVLRRSREEFRENKAISDPSKVR